MRSSESPCGYARYFVVVDNGKVAPTSRKASEGVNFEVTLSPSHLLLVAASFITTMGVIRHHCPSTPLHEMLGWIVMLQQGILGGNQNLPNKCLR